METGVLGRGILTILTMTILTTCGSLEGRRECCMSGFFRFKFLFITLEISNFAREERCCSTGFLMWRNRGCPPPGRWFLPSGR